MDLRAHAKINLHLHSVQRRKDGYHELDTVFCHLDLHDDVHVTLRQGVIELESQTGLSVTEDLAGRAATSLQAELSDAALGCALRIIKRIPAGGGLGGGSADAAAVLRGLAELWPAACYGRLPRCTTWRRRPCSRVDWRSRRCRRW